jgi:hypothetical protein
MYEYRYGVYALDGAYFISFDSARHASALNNLLITLQITSMQCCNSLPCSPEHWRSQPPPEAVAIDDRCYTCCPTLCLYPSQCWYDIPVKFSVHGKTQFGLKRHDVFLNMYYLPIRRCTRKAYSAAQKLCSESYHRQLTLLCHTW